ncbi:MAG: hypothetical protein PHO74_01125 [Weeksellaceae bacterium]|jgi:uncharacterized membrane protein|nr:hypothetical protein [Weeksellaceae bacterium]
MNNQKNNLLLFELNSKIMQENATNNPSGENTNESGMDEKTMGIVSYLTIVGWIIVLAVRKSKTEYTSFHLRQMAGLIALSIGIFIISMVLSVVTFGLGFLFNLLSLGVLILWIFGLIGALNNEMKPVPLFGEQFQQWFKTMF